MPAARRRGRARLPPDCRTESLHGERAGRRPAPPIHATRMASLRPRPPGAGEFVPGRGAGHAVWGGRATCALLRAAVACWVGAPPVHTPVTVDEIVSDTPLVEPDDGGSR
jgi:hypothetical protein